jgi:hypothetical protein
MKLIKGLSFSWSRFLGIAGIKNKLARKTGIPTTRGGQERKVGRKIIEILFGKKK